MTNPWVLGLYKFKKWDNMTYEKSVIYKWNINKQESNLNRSENFLSQIISEKQREREDFIAFSSSQLNYVWSTGSPIFWPPILIIYIWKLNK